MRLEIESINDSWADIAIVIERGEIDGLIERLHNLKSGGHFHIVNKFKEVRGISDVEFSLQGTSELSNAELG